MSDKYQLVQSRKGRDSSERVGLWKVVHREWSLDKDHWESYVLATNARDAVIAADAHIAIIFEFDYNFHIQSVEFICDRVDAAPDIVLVPASEYEQGQRGVRDD